MKTSRKLCPRWAEFNQVRLCLPSLAYLFSDPLLPHPQPKTTVPNASLPTSFGGGLALPAMGAAAAPKPANLKVTLGGGNKSSAPATPAAAGSAASPPPSSTPAPGGGTPPAA